MSNPRAENVRHTYVKVKSYDWALMKRKVGSVRNLNLLNHEKDLLIKNQNAEIVKLKRGKMDIQKALVKICTQNKDAGVSSLIQQFKSADFHSDHGYGESVMFSRDPISTDGAVTDDDCKSTGESISDKKVFLPDDCLHMNPSSLPSSISIQSAESESLSKETSESFLRKVDFVPTGVSPMIFNSALSELKKTKQLFQDLLKSGINVYDHSERCDFKEKIANLEEEITVLRDQLAVQQTVLLEFAKNDSESEKVVNVILFLQETVQKLHKEVHLKTEMMKNLEKSNRQLKEKKQQPKMENTETSSFEIPANVKLNVSDPGLPIKKISDDEAPYVPSGQFMMIKEESGTQTDTEWMFNERDRDMCHMEVQTNLEWSTVLKNEQSHIDAINFLKTVLSNAQKRMASLEQEIESANSQLSTLKKERDELAASNEKLQDDLQNSYWDLETLTRIKEFNEDSALKEHETAINLEARLKIEKEEHQKMQGIIKELREQVNRLAVENSYIRSHHPAFKIDSSLPQFHKSKSVPNTERMSVEESQKMSTYDFAPSSSTRMPVELEAEFDVKSRGSSSDYRSISPAFSETLFAGSSGRTASSDYTCSRCLRTFCCEDDHLQHYQKCID